MADVTFRDFAGAVMKGDEAAAGTVLQQLLGISATAATAGSAHFKQRMATDPSFMQKAMGLRTAVTTGSDAEIQALLGDCFGLDAATATTATTALRKQYPAA